jgi:predicted glycosyltransferase
LDDPATVRREWQAANNEQTVGDYFDAVWVYGDPAVHNVVRAHDFSPEIAAKVRFTGYFDHRKRLEWAHKADCSVPLSRQETRSGKRLALCLVGGGQDGSHVAEMFAKTVLPEDYYGLLVTGPFMPAETRQRLRRIAADNTDLEVIKQISEPVQLLQVAHRVIAMGGYNTVNEILSFGKRALIVPRVEPRQEQLIRAERFSELGLIDCIHPDRVTPEKFAEWLAREPEPIPPVGEVVNMRGLERLPLLLQELLEPSANLQMPVVKDAYSEEAKYVA